VERPGKKTREVDLRQIVGDVKVSDDGRLEFDVRQDVGSAKPWEVVATLAELELARARDGRYLLISALRREVVGAAAGGGDDAEEPAAESA
jgi:hypothetical protein